MPESRTQSPRDEFNRWAESGRGDGMEQDHLPITLPVIEKMRIGPAENVLDVGCGSGWLSRRISKLVPDGQVVGMDVSDEMIRIARRTSREHHNVQFITGEVAATPQAASLFTHAISVESDLLLARACRRCARNPPRASPRRDGVDSDQLLWRQCLQPSVGSPTCRSDSFVRRAGTGGPLPRSGFCAGIARANRRPLTDTGGLHGAVVPRCGGTPRAES
jgi:SAM-dependent methyltransferase